MCVTISYHSYTKDEIGNWNQFSRDLFVNVNIMTKYVMQKTNILWIQISPENAARDLANRH